MNTLEQVLNYVKSITETLNKWADNAKKAEELPVMESMDSESLLIVSQLVNGVRTSKQLEIQKIIDGISLSGQDNKVREFLLGTITADEDLAYLLDNNGLTVAENEIIVLTVLDTIAGTLVQKQYLWKLGKGSFSPIGSANISQKLLELQPRFINEITADELTNSPQAIVYDFGTINNTVLEVINGASPARDYNNEEKIYYIRATKDGVNLLYNFIGINGIYGSSELQMNESDLVLVYSSQNTDITGLLQSLVSQEQLATSLDDVYYYFEEVKLPEKADRETTYTKEEVDSKINNNFKGVYLTEAALIAAHPTANIGDYAQVNEVGATDVVNYNWDGEENIWVKNITEGGSGANNTDELPEGTTNLYFTVARFLANLTYANIIAALGFTPSQAPNNAQKNSDITKAEIEAKLTGEITSHTHPNSGGGDMTTTSDQTVSGIKTYLSGKLGLRNVANTFTSFFINANTASRTYIFQDRDAIILDNKEITLVPADVKILNAGTFDESTYNLKRSSNGGHSRNIDFEHTVNWGGPGGVAKYRFRLKQLYVDDNFFDAWVLENIAIGLAKGTLTGDLEVTRDLKVLGSISLSKITLVPTDVKIIEGGTFDESIYNQKRSSNGGHSRNIDFEHTVNWGGTGGVAKYRFRIKQLYVDDDFIDALVIENIATGLAKGTIKGDFVVTRNLKANGFDLSNLGVYSNDAAAASGGVAIGFAYINSSTGAMHRRLI